MSADSRSAILARIRSANSSVASTDREAKRKEEWNALPREYRKQGILSEIDRIELFDERIRHYNGTPFYSSGDVTSDIAKILQERGKRTLVVPSGLPDAWLPQGFRFIRDDRLSKSQLDSVEGVITGGILGIALTGTVVLESSPSEGRRAATLIPDYHLCVLRKDDIVELVPEAIRRLEHLKNHPLTFFSGPSATVDIEMTRVRGVHGPRTLDILLV